MNAAMANYPRARIGDAHGQPPVDGTISDAGKAGWRDGVGAHLSCPVRKAGANRDCLWQNKFHSASRPSPAWARGFRRRGWREGQVVCGDPPLRTTRGLRRRWSPVAVKRPQGPARNGGVLCFPNAFTQPPTHSTIRVSRIRSGPSCIHQHHLFISHLKGPDKTVRGLDFR